MWSVLWKAGRLDIRRLSQEVSRRAICVRRALLLAAGVLIAVAVAEPGLPLPPHSTNWHAEKEQQGPVPPRPGALSVAETHRVKLGYGSLSLSFEPNRGQAGQAVKFLAHGLGYALVLERGGMRFLLPARPSSTYWPKLFRPVRSSAGLGSYAFSLLPFPALFRHASGFPVRSEDETSGLRINLVGTSGRTRITGLGELPGKTNYFIGNNPAMWRTNIPHYSEVRYGGVYPGVNLICHGNGRRLEFDFIVAPGADLKAITLGIADGKGQVRNGDVRIDAKGDLVVDTGDTEMRFTKPVVYQEDAPLPRRRGTEEQGKTRHGKSEDYGSSLAARRILDGRYVLTADHRIHFVVPKYDRSQPLVIDPTLVYSTYFWTGGAIAVDASGAAYVFGSTNQTSLPTVNAAQPSYRGGSSDTYIAKLSPDGSTLMYATYLGGNGVDEPSGIAVNSSGNAYMTGYTTSTNFPTWNPFQSQCTVGSNGACSDAFIAELSADGSSLLYSTYLGGSGDDAPQGIAVDSSGNAYLAGNTNSEDFPTANALQTVAGGGTCTTATGAGFLCRDAFVTELSATGDALIFSTYLGGSADDAASGIAVDSSGTIFVTGGTGSANFPVTPGAFQTSLRGTGGFDAFVAEIDSSAPKLLYSTLLGGSEADSGNSLVLDGSGNTYIQGKTESNDFPVTSGAFQTAFHGPSGSVLGGDFFVSKLNCTLSNLIYSTYLGGSKPEVTFAPAVGTLAADSAGDAFVVGSTQSPDFPVVNALQSSYQGGFFDTFVSELSPDGRSAVFSSYLGGSGDDEAGGVTVDAAGDAYVTGGTSSTNFPMMTPIQSLPSAGAFLAKIAPSTAGVEGFALSASPCPGTVAAGQSTSYRVTVAPTGGFNNPVSLSCSNLPRGAACSISPSSVMLDGINASTATVTVTTTARSSAPPTGQNYFPQDPVFWFLAVLLLLGLVVGAICSGRRADTTPKLPNELCAAVPADSRRRPRYRPVWILPALVLLGLLFLYGCGSSSGSGGGGGGGGGGTTSTPAGNYVLTFSGTGGSMTCSTDVTLVID